VSSTNQPRFSATGGGVFLTTRWSVVIAAGNTSSQATDALAELCGTYWYPLYCYVRRRGHSPEDAQDFTQEFFARLVERNWLSNANREKGRFRSFLLGAMNHFLADQRDKSHALKRGGGVPLLPLDFDTAESRFTHEPGDSTTPEQNFERRWVLALLERVLNRLTEEYKRDGREELFTLLNPCLIGERTAQPYTELAVQLDTTEGTVKSAVHRLRLRYRELLREEIADTVAGPGEVEDELRYLFAVLARR